MREQMMLEKDKLLIGTNMKKYYKTQIHASTNYPIHLLYYGFCTNLEYSAITAETNLHNSRHDMVSTRNNSLIRRNITSSKLLGANDGDLTLILSP